MPNSPKHETFFCWMLFALASLFWLLLPLLFAPSFSGVDAFIFRDAGWNLAATGRFESLGLPYMTDLHPRLYAHYLPGMPLLFAAYCSVFPRNATAGTLFNTILGVLAAAAVLLLLLRQTSSRLRSLTLAMVALFPALFVTYDRPESLGVILFALTMMAAWREKPHPVLLGTLLGLTCLCHPFAGILAFVWCVCALWSRNPEGTPWASLRRICWVGLCAGLILLATYLLYRWHDESAIQRFLSHALGRHSGLGASRGQGFLTALKHGISSSGFVAEMEFACFVLVNLFAFVFAFHAAWRGHKRWERRDWAAMAAIFLGTCLVVALFPGQGNYFVLVSFAIPIGMLAAASSSTATDRSALATPALLLMLAVCLWHLPLLGLSTVSQVELRQSFLRAQEQPSHLLAQLPSKQSVVVMDGYEYDLYKPELPRLINAAYLEDQQDIGKIAGVVNCYDFFHGSAETIKPLPAPLAMSDFRKVESAPDHVFLTLFHHRLMRSQQGWGCDLYVRQR